jgi:MoaA/NifB/PqqE/SkfB family radical SAM enzyme
MGVVSNLQRKWYFAQYNLIPFRLSLVTTHIAKRFLSALRVSNGFRIIDLALTYECNFHCRHCSAMVMKRDAAPLTLDDYKSIVRQSKELDPLSWNITGGEPLLVEWIDELIPILKPKTHFITFQTNCSLLDEKRAKKLAALGVNCITTSLDSIVPEEHNDFRQFPDSYSKVFEGVRNARKAGMKTLIGVTVTHQNIRSSNLKALIERINEEKSVCLFNLAIPCGEWEGNEAVILHGDDRNYLNELLEKYPRTSTDHEVGRNAKGCPAGMEKIYITPYGDVLPCPFIQVNFGNIRKNTLKEIVERMRKVPEFSQYQKICLAAEDPDFHKNVLDKISRSRDARPISYEKIYGELDE